MRRLVVTLAVVMLATMSVAGPVAAKREFGSAYVDDAIYRVFGNPANVPAGSGTDPFAVFTNSLNADQFGVAEFAPGSPGGHHGGRWAVYHATWTMQGDRTALVTRWSDLKGLQAEGKLILTRVPEADFRCPVLGNPSTIG